MVGHYRKCRVKYPGAERREGADGREEYVSNAPQIAMFTSKRFEFAVSPPYDA
jgi:hypothetical protein